MKNPLEWLSELLLTLTAIPMLAMMIHVTLDVFLKYALGAPIQSTLEITSYYYMVAIVVFPIAFVEFSRSSIAVELFYQFMPYRLQVATVALVLLLSALSYGLLVYVSWPDAMRAYRMKEIVMGTVNVYIWPARFLLPAALALTTLVCLTHLVRLIVSKQARRELTDVETVEPDAGAS